MALSYLLIGIVLLLIFVIGRRVLSGRKGSKFSVQSIYTRPIIYIVLTAVLVITGTQLFEIPIIILAVILGVFLGRILGKGSNIFEKNGKVMYRRSNEVLAIWLVAFVIRIAINFLTDPYLRDIVIGTPIPGSVTISTILAVSTQFSWILFGADILLAFSAGLLLGEALILHGSYKEKYKSKSV